MSAEVVARGCCPQCGGGLPLGRGGGTVACTYCNLTSSYTLVPAPGAPAPCDALAAITIVPLHASRDTVIAGWTATTLEAFDPSSGRSVWTATMPRGPIVSSFERIYVPTETGELVALDAATGRIAFVATLPGPASHVADVSGPIDHARVLVHVGGELLALARMSGEIVERWRADEPRCWVTAPNYLLAGPIAGEVWLVDPARPTPIARLPVADVIGGSIATGHAFVATTTGHTALQLADGAVAWRAHAPWNPATGARAAFVWDLFLADGASITSLPGGARVEAPGPITDLRMIAGTVIAAAGSQLVAYQRTLAPAWHHELRDFEVVRIADNGRMLVVALGRDDQLWVRGLLPTTGKARWNVLVPSTSPLVRHAVVGDLVMIETEHQRYVLRADTGQVLRSARR